MGWEHVIFEIFILTCCFVLGTIIGSLLNVCIYRLPLEKSILWPGSHCMNCLTFLKGRSNVPIFSWLLSRGRCRHCGVQYSSRYMWIELMTGVLFALIAYADFFLNVHDIPFVAQNRFRLQFGDFPWQFIVIFIRDAVLVSYLIVAAFCDIDHKWIPFTVTMPGTVIGLFFSTLFPWCWPNNPVIVQKIPVGPWFMPPVIGEIPAGLTAWPAWGPLPDWLPPNSFQMGLVNAFAGAAAGMFFVRAVRFLFLIALKREPLGLGDADLMMMVGAFLGWQMIVVAFFVGSFAALFTFPILSLVKRKGDDEGFPFGPGLVLGSIITWFAWPKIGPKIQEFFFSEIILGSLAVFLTVGILLLTPLVSYVLHRGEEPVEPSKPGT